MSDKSNEKEQKTTSEDVNWKDILEGGTVPYSGNADLYKTGDWRSMKPIWLVDKCTQCLLCYPVCPDTSILIEDGERVDFDYDHCKGCGVCVRVCPFGAIDFVEESE